MDPLKFTTIAHRDHIFCNPLSSQKIDTLLSLLELPSGARVLDSGCGKGEILVRLSERYQIEGVGVDSSPYFLGEARKRAASRVPDGKLTWLEMEIDRFQAGPASFDLAICIGASHLYGDYRATLQNLKELVRPGGQLLIGEGYWKREPDPGYLAMLGATREELTDYAGNVLIGIEEGLTPLYVTVSSEDDWDHYEWLYACSVERYALEQPHDPDLPALLERSHKGRDRYLQGGRDVLGFGLYLFHFPEF